MRRLNFFMIIEINWLTQGSSPQLRHNYRMQQETPMPREPVDLLLSTNSLSQLMHKNINGCRITCRLSTKSMIDSEKSMKTLKNGYSLRNA